MVRHYSRKSKWGTIERCHGPSFKQEERMGYHRALQWYVITASEANEVP
ncbi:hypothetical protein [Virgibacillus kimchii]